MIKANELRIGNIIRFYNLIEPEIFIKINARFFCSLAGGRPLSELKDDEEINGYHQPVELTPDILEAAGFTNGIKTIETSFLETEFYVDLMDGDAGFNKHGLWFPCKHLHQLQNLYYCLTGEELQIDITKLNKEK